MSNQLDHVNGGIEMVADPVVPAHWIGATTPAQARELANEPLHMTVVPLRNAVLSLAGQVEALTAEKAGWEADQQENLRNQCDLQSQINALRLKVDANQLVQQPQQSAQPVAWLVTGPYEKSAFTSLSGAEYFCRGLNTGYGEDAYSVTPLGPIETIPSNLE